MPKKSACSSGIGWTRRQKRLRPPTSILPTACDDRRSTAATTRCSVLCRPRAAGGASGRDLTAQRRHRAIRPTVCQARVVPERVFALAPRRVSEPSVCRLRCGSGALARGDRDVTVACAGVRGRRGSASRAGVTLGLRDRRQSPSRTEADDDRTNPRERRLPTEDWRPMTSSPCR